jgi:O-acetyl-ADP-ribose deacetylase (regulator of RNase III)
MALVDEILIRNQTKLRLIRGDITERNVDAIVNAANSYVSMAEV